MAETREVYEQVEDETGRTRSTDCSCGGGEGAGRVNRSGSTVGRTGRFDPDLSGGRSRRQVKAEQVVDALASGGQPTATPSTSRLSATEDQCAPLLGAEVEPGQSEGLDPGRTDRLDLFDSGRLKKMSASERT